MRLFILFLLMMVSMLWACNESKVSVFSVIANDFYAEKFDSILVDVETNGAVLELKGEIDLIAGECILIFRNPDQDTIYHEIYQAPEKVKLNSEFSRSEGEWVFIYQIKRLDDIQPTGSLNLQIIYRN